MESGQIVGDNPDSVASILWTDQTYGDFEMTLEYKSLVKDYDSGVFLRGMSHQVQIGISRSLQKDMTGCIYAPNDGKGGYPAQSEKVLDFHKEGEWNRIKIRVEGKRIQTWLNDEPFVDYQGETIESRGPVGLQLHGGVAMKILFRNLEIRDI